MIRANPLSPAIRERETFFGPFIEQVEARTIAQQNERWDRELFENHLMGYAVRTDRVTVHRTNAFLRETKGSGTFFGGEVQYRTREFTLRNELDPEL